jgi:hypothetical protein
VLVVLPAMVWATLALDERERAAYDKRMLGDRIGENGGA